IERTFSILKPDATERNLTGAINAVIEKAGLRIVAQKRMRISREQAEKFYAVHRERPFFLELVDFMISGPVVVQALEADNAIANAWGRPTRPRLQPELSASFMRGRSGRTPCTARMHLILLYARLRSSFQKTRSSAKVL